MNTPSKNVNNDPFWTSPRLRFAIRLQFGAQGANSSQSLDTGAYCSAPAKFHIREEFFLDLKLLTLTEGRLKLTFPDGATMEDKHNAGDAEWLDAQWHAGENLGDSSIVIEAVMLKQH